MDISSHLRDLILAAIQQQGLTEKQCAVSCGISTGFFADWKAGRVKSPSFEKVYNLCKYLNISIDSLNFETDNRAMNIDKDTETNKDEQRILEKYRLLDEDGKDAVRGVLLAEQRRIETKAKSKQAI